jgi:hypothetical protein
MHNFVFLWRINRKQPSDTTHGRCMMSKSKKFQTKKTNTCFSRVTRTRTIIIRHFVHKKSRHLSQWTSLIRYPPPPEIYNFEQTRTTPRNISTGLNIIARNTQVFHAVVPSHIHRRYKFFARLKRHLKCAYTLDWNLSPPHASTVGWHMHFPCK